MGREVAAAIQRWPALIDHPVRPRLTAVCDINPEALLWFDQIDTVTVKTTDYQALLAEGSIDVLYIAVRHDLHEAMYTDAIRAGKSLLAEKPFGIDLAAAENIIKTITAHPESFVRCSSEMPFFPGAQQAIAMIRSGIAGQLIQVRSAFLHSSDLDRNKPINWKRRKEFCGEAGVMNDLGLHALHVPLRLGWEPTTVFASLHDLVPTRPGPNGQPTVCDTFENAELATIVADGGREFPMSIATHRISPGNANTWELEVFGFEGGVRFSTKNPKSVQAFTVADPPGLGPRQTWQTWDTGSQSVWPTVTGAIFEAGFSDAVLQMWAAFLAEWAGELGDRFACATPSEAVATHRVIAAALRSHAEDRNIRVGTEAG